MGNSRDLGPSFVQEDDRGKLWAENDRLRRERDALRDIFVRQQQQQIAFWAGPFMEFGSTPCDGGLVAQLPSAFAADGAREDCFRKLREERDYWRSLAEELKKELASLRSSKNTESERSISQQAPWSDNGSDLSALSAS